MRAFTPNDILLLYAQGGIPKALTDGWKADHDGDNPIDTAQHKKNAMTLMEPFIAAFLVLGVGIVGATFPLRIYAPQNVFPAVVAAVVCCDFAGILFVLREMIKKVVTKGFGKYYALLLDYFRTNAAGISHEPRILLNTAGELLSKQGMRLKVAEARSMENEQNFHDKSIADQERKELAAMFEVMAKFGLADRKTGWGPFVGERPPTESKAAD